MFHKIFKKSAYVENFLFYKTIFFQCYFFTLSLDVKKLNCTTHMVLDHLYMERHFLEKSKMQNNEKCLGNVPNANVY